MKSSFVVPPSFSAPASSIPDWWVSEFKPIERFLKTKIKKGKLQTFGKSADGHSLYAVTYGKPRRAGGTTTYSGSVGCGKIEAYRGPDAKKRVAVVLAGLHGGEFEPIVGAVNLLSILETGKDLRGKPAPQLLKVFKAVDRLIVIPVYSPDSRLRIPLRMMAFTGTDSTVASYLNTGATKKGLIGWPQVKEWIPLDFKKCKFPGGYPNGNGVNLQHDDFFSPNRQPETEALFKLMSLEKPNLVLNLHSGVPMDDYYMKVHKPQADPSVYPVWESFFRHVHTGLARAGLQSTRDPRLEADPSKSVAGCFNLDTALNYHCGALSSVVESPSHSYTGYSRSGQLVPMSLEALLDAQLILYTESFRFLKQSISR
ncbi:MAG: hypothetical protein V4507_02985 [Verrucomicrobiota bacterium]